MIYVVLTFLAVSLVLYVLLAGADFGAGIIELFSSKPNQSIMKKTIYRVMGPVWEANHIWIIILIVILWIGFPMFYNYLMISLHIPITLVLLGITLRGVAFVFRHYDAIIDHSQKVYNLLFRISSLCTPFFLGITFGGVVSGEIPHPDQLNSIDFTTAYISPWLNSFSMLIGCFFTALCAFLTSILLIGEASQENKAVYVRKSKVATLAVVIIGFIVLLAGYFLKLPFVLGIINHTYAVIAIVISGLLLVPLFGNIKKGKAVQTRILAGLQVLFILSVALVPHFPNVLFTDSGTVSLLHQTAPGSVIKVLGITLIIGGLVIIPGLFHLLKSFKMIKILEKE